MFLVFLTDFFLSAIIYFQAILGLFMPFSVFFFVKIHSHAWYQHFATAKLSNCVRLLRFLAIFKPYFCHVIHPIWTLLQEIMVKLYRAIYPRLFVSMQRRDVLELCNAIKITQQRFACASQYLQ